MGLNILPYTRLLVMHGLTILQLRSHDMGGWLVPIGIHWVLSGHTDITDCHSKSNYHKCKFEHSNMNSWI